MASVELQVLQIQLQDCRLHCEGGEGGSLTAQITKDDQGSVTDARFTCHDFNMTRTGVGQRSSDVVSIDYDPKERSCSHFHCANHVNNDGRFIDREALARQARAAANTIRVRLD